MNRHPYLVVDTSRVTEQLAGSVAIAGPVALGLPATTRVEQRAFLRQVREHLLDEERMPSVS